jgi:hypothetical protein
MDKLLHKIYYEEHNYDGIEQLYNKAKVIDKTIKKEFVREWLSKQQNKQMTVRKVGKKEFLPIYSEMNNSFQIDLTFFPRYKKQNDNYYVLFTAININTRYVYAYKAKDKNMSTILNIMQLMEKKTVINSITADEGTEFKNVEFQTFCNKNNIECYFVKGDGHKLGIINRFHRTLKDKLTKYFLAKDTVRWIDVIDKIIYNYNHTVNRGIGTEPYKVDAKLEHEIIVWKRAQTDILNTKNDKLLKGDMVRIINKRVLFDDKMLPNYSNDIYKIIKVKKNSCIINMKGNNIEIKNSQLLRVNSVENNKTLEEIPKILKEAKKDIALKRSGVDSGDILKSKRVKKENPKFLV